MRAKSKDSKGKEEFFIGQTPLKIDFDANNIQTPKIDNESKLKKLFSTTISTDLSINKHLTSSKYYSIQLDNEIKEANEDDII